MREHRFPRSLPDSKLFGVRVDGREIEVKHTEPADFAIVGIDGLAEIEVHTPAPVENAIVRPLSHGIEPEVDGNVVAFSLDGPADLSVELDGHKPLYLFAGAPEEDAPSPDEPGIHYFRGGQVHEVGQLVLEDGQTLYLEPGAVVRGCVRATDARNVAIRGRGVIDGSYYTRGVDAARTVLFRGCDGVVVEGVTMIQATSWTLDLELCSDVRVSGVRQITAGHGRDGIDVVSCQDVLIEGCFLRNGDDCVAIKARSPEENPDRETDVRNVLVRGCTIANVGCGNAMEIGHELRTASVGDVTFRDIDVLCVEGYGAAFSIHNSDRATVHDVLYEDIRIEHYFTFLIDWRVLHSRWSKDDRRGQVRRVRLRDVRVHQSIYNPGYSISIIGGLDPEHTVEGVLIEDVYFDDAKVRDADDLDLYAKNTTGLEIR